MWPGIIAAGIGAAADLIGGHSAKKAQQKANQQNIALQRENQAWEEKMSNTSWIRGSADMRAAGLNPMLAYSQGGASTPNTSAATVSPADGFAKGISSAGNKAAQALSLENLAANTAVTREKAKQEQMVTNDMKEDRSTVTITDDEGNTVGGMSPAQRKRMKESFEAEMAKLNVRAKDVETQILEETKDANVRSAQDRARILEKEVTFNEMRNILQALQKPEAEAMAKWFETVGAASPAVKAAMSISQWIKFILR